MSDRDGKGGFNPLSLIGPFIVLPIILYVWCGMGNRMGFWNGGNGVGWNAADDGRWRAEQEAKRQAAEREATELAAGFDTRDPLDLTGAADKAARVRALIAEYPEASGTAERAVATWELRAAEVLTKPLAAGDAAAFRERANERATLAGVSPTSRERLIAAETAWAERTAQVVIDPVADLAKTDPPAARKKYAACAKELATLPGVAGEGFPAARKRLAAAALDAARWQMQPHIAADRFEQAEAEAKAVAAEWKDEAAATGLTAEYARFADGFAYLAALSRLAADKP